MGLRGTLGSPGPHYVPQGQDAWGRAGWVKGWMGGQGCGLAAQLGRGLSTLEGPAVREGPQAAQDSAHVQPPQPLPVVTVLTG